LYPSPFSTKPFMRDHDQTFHVYHDSRRGFSQLADHDVLPIEIEPISDHATSLASQRRSEALTEQDREKERVGFNGCEMKGSWLKHVRFL
jgi:hypothetical protein